MICQDCAFIVNGCIWEDEDRDYCDHFLQKEESIVHCKDCVYWRKQQGNEFVGGCEVAKWMCGATGYCLYGKRAE